MSTKLGTAKIYFKNEDLGKMLKLKDKDNLMVTDVDVDNVEGKVSITITTPEDNATNDRVKIDGKFISQYRMSLGETESKEIKKDTETDGSIINKTFFTDNELDALFNYRESNKDISNLVLNNIMKKGISKITYEIVYENIKTGEQNETTSEYETIEECKKDFGLYTGDIERVVGVRKIEHLESVMDIEKDKVVHEKIEDKNDIANFIKTYDNHDIETAVNYYISRIQNAEVLKERIYLTEKDHEVFKSLKYIIDQYNNR